MTNSHHWNHYGSYTSRVWQELRITLELPLVRVRYAGNFAAALRPPGANKDPYLPIAHLDPEILGFADNHMPVSQLHRLVAAAVENTGLTQLGDGLMKLSDFAARLGYRYNIHFSRSFRNACETPPPQFRNE